MTDGKVEGESKLPSSSGDAKHSIHEVPVLMSLETTSLGVD